MNQAFNMDCMTAMKEMPDNAFDLAVVDPPYGIRRFENGATSRLAKYGSFESVNDAVPTPEYFEQLFRVSKNQIVWGYNHLSNLLPNCTNYVFWYKHQTVETYAAGELAWTSFGGWQSALITRFGALSVLNLTGFTQRKSLLRFTSGF